MRYLFQLGRHPKISTAEIEAVFLLWKFKADIIKKDDWLLAETDKVLNTQKLIERLGGTIKIGIKIEEPISDYLVKRHNQGKIEFSINDKKVGMEIKKKLQKMGRAARYIEPKNTATIIKNNLIEKRTDFTTIDGAFFVTQSIQQIDEYSRRDYGRPSRDDLSGMLPPKLAKIMINLARVNDKTEILDPFCGSGTIVSEASLMNYTNLIAADVSKKAIHDTKTNLDWLHSNYKTKNINLKTYTVDARRIDTKFSKNSVGAIITEPFLGSPLRGHETKTQLQNQALELKKLYLNAFKSFSKILKTDGVVVFIFPSFRVGKEIIETTPVEEIKKNGFEPTPLSNEEVSLKYHRQGQFVARNIWRFIRK